jgi:hypothetical protein
MPIRFVALGRSEESQRAAFLLRNAHFERRRDEGQPKLCA